MECKCGCGKEATFFHSKCCCAHFEGRAHNGTYWLECEKCGLFAFMLNRVPTKGACPECDATRIIDGAGVSHLFHDENCKIANKLKSKGMLDKTICNDCSKQKVK